MKRRKQNLFALEVKVAKSVMGTTDNDSNISSLNFIMSLAAETSPSPLVVHSSVETATASGSLVEGKLYPSPPNTFEAEAEAPSIINTAFCTVDCCVSN